jgi:hypothetical protein
MATQETFSGAKNDTKSSIGKNIERSLAVRTDWSSVTMAVVASVGKSSALDGM